MIEERRDEGVWRILGPILLAIVLTGGGGWLAYVQAQITSLTRKIDEQSEGAGDMKERMRGVEVGLEAVKAALGGVAGDARDARDGVQRILTLLREEQASAHDPKTARR